MRRKTHAAVATTTGMHMGATAVAAMTMQSAMSMCAEIRAKAVMLIHTHAAASNCACDRVSLRRPVVLIVLIVCMSPKGGVP